MKFHGKLKKYLVTSGVSLVRVRTVGYTAANKDPKSFRCTAGAASCIECPLHEREYLNRAELSGRHRCPQGVVVEVPGRKRLRALGPKCRERGGVLLPRRCCGHRAYARHQLQGVQSQTRPLLHYPAGSCVTRTGCGCLWRPSERSFTDTRVEKVTRPPRSPRVLGFVNISTLRAGPKGAVRAVNSAAVTVTGRFPRNTV